MDTQKYEPVIGLEIHVELKTKSKMFCGCSAYHFDKPPNSQTCPVCLGLPGALPVPNKKAIEWTILMGKALNCKINNESKFDRKHYFYPDLPKGYQITQYDEPIAVKGYLQIEQKKKIGITRIHLEEDTGKLIHSTSDTLVDFNRAGVPLVEIVTEPDFNNSQDVKQFLEELHTIIRYLGISDADMDKGSMRMEPNISVRVVDVIASEAKQSITQIATSADVHRLPRNDKLPPYKVEVKNINSFNFVKRAIDYEVKRHIELLEKGETPAQETRGWDSDHNRTYSQRSKEEAHDYRYFPEPDIPPFEFTEEYIESIKKTLPELPQAKMYRYIEVFKLRPMDAFNLTRNYEMSRYFEEVMSLLTVQSSKFKVQSNKLGQEVANFIMNKKISIDLSVDEFVENAIKLMTPVETDTGLLDTIITKLIAANPKVVADYKSGKQNSLMFFVGQVMREMRGKAEAKLIIEKLKQKLA